MHPEEDMAEDETAHAEDDTTESNDEDRLAPAGNGRDVPATTAKSAAHTLPPSMRCGRLPDGFTLTSFHVPPSKVHVRN